MMTVRICKAVTAVTVTLMLFTLCSCDAIFPKSKIEAGGKTVAPTTSATATPAKSPGYYSMPDITPVVTDAPTPTPLPTPTPMPTFAPTVVNGTYNGNGFSMSVVPLLGAGHLDENGIMSFSSVDDGTHSMSIATESDDPADSFVSYPTEQMREIMLREFSSQFGTAAIQSEIISIAGHEVIHYTFDYVTLEDAWHTELYLFYVQSTAQVVTVIFMCDTDFVGLPQTAEFAQSMINTLAFQ